MKVKVKFTPHQYCRGRCLGLPGRGAKNLCISDFQPQMSAFYYFAIFLLYSTSSTDAADVWGWQSEMQTCFSISGSSPPNVGLLLSGYFTASLHIQRCRGRCLGLAAQNAKKFANLGQPSPNVGLLLFYYVTTLLHIQC